MTSEQQQDRYYGAVPTEVVIEGKVFWVNVHLAQVDGRFVCVGLDLRSFYEPTPGVAEIAGEAPSAQRTQAVIRHLRAQRSDGEAPTVVVPTNDTFVEITSPIVRALRTSEVIETAQAPIRELLRQVADTFVREMGLQGAADVILGPWQREVPKRGPRPLLDEQALRDVVAATYRVSPKRPVQAVREALESSGLLGSRVTIDQARKAVMAARARGFIPPAKRPARTEGEKP